MSYEITPQDFCSIVGNPSCKGTETENGTAKQGHSNCQHCKGNYFVGGECNYGGCHNLTKDLSEINRNFRSFDVLIAQQVKLSKSQNEKEFDKSKQTLLSSFTNLKQKCEEQDGASFFYGSCIGISDSKLQFLERVKDSFKRLAKELAHYIKQIEITTWQQLHQFQVKIKQLNKLSQESNQLTEEWKDEEDPVKKSQLFALLTANNNVVAKLRVEIQSDPTFAIFSQEKSDELANIVKNIFQGDANKSFFDWQAKENVESVEPQSEKYFGLIPKKSANNALIFVGGCLVIGFIYHFCKRKFTN